MKHAPAEALLFGSGVTILGVLRCLGPLGIPVRVVSEDPTLFRRSRWYRPAPPCVEDGLEEYLESRPMESAVLIPCSDKWVRAVADIPPELKGRFPSSVSPPALLERFLDKGLFAQLLQEKGIPHPKTVVGQGALDAGDLGGLHGFFIKPRDSQLFQERFGVKAFWPESEGELLRDFRAVREEGFEVLLQEYVPGPSSNHYFVDGFVDGRGRIRAVFVRRRLRMHPPRFGNSCYMVSVSPQEAGPAVSAMEELLGGGEYRGVFSAEFKKDENDGLFKLLEVNTRPWWFVEFAANCGVNFLEMTYRDALEQPVGEVWDYAVGKRFIYPYFDISACLRERSGKVKGLLQLLKSIPGADRPILRWNDPLPVWSDFVDLTKKFLARKLRKGIKG